MSLRRLVNVLVMILVGAAVTVPGAARADWPFPDDNVLPLVREDVVAGTASAAYRITVTDQAPVAFEVASTDNGGRFATGLIEYWPTDGSTAPQSQLGTRDRGALERVHIASDPLALDVETAPNATGPDTTLATVDEQLAPGTWIVVMLAGGDTPNTATYFHIHGVNITVAAASFGSAVVAGPEHFRGVANATALDATAVVDGHVAVNVGTALSGLFAAYTSVAQYTGPDGSHIPPLAQLFQGAQAGAYDFTALVGVSPPLAPLSPFVALADVAIPT